MHTVSIPDFQDMIEHVAIGENEPVMGWGQPGVGKTEAVYQVTQRLGGTMVDVRASQWDSVDIRGLPDRDGNSTVWLQPSVLPFKGNPRFREDERPIVLFLDEINSGAPAVLAVCYQIVNERRAGEHVLMDNVRIVAAGNREGDKGVVTKMPLPLANRFTHVEVGLDVDAWCWWAQTAGVPPVGVAFMQFRKNLLSTFDPAKTDKAFATPRTWQKALRYYASKSMPVHTKQAAMAGAVGDGPSAEFWAFNDVWSKLVPIKEIIRNPQGAPLPDEPAMMYAVAVAVSGSMEAKTTHALHSYLKRLDPEFCVLAWSLALKRDDTLDRTPEFLDFSKHYRAVFR